MADFPTSARIVIIGGGVVGVSTLYHLANRGWTDCVLLEKNELTAGSTWHAAGNCPSFSTSCAVMNMQRYPLDLYRGLAEEVGYPVNYHVTGSIRLTHIRERMQEFARARSMGQYQGMAPEMMTPDEAQAAYPFLETHDLVGALYDPGDGDIDPAQLTQALAKGARAMGARIERFCPATGVTQTADGWIVHTDKGDIACEKVVNAAGYYAQHIGEWFKPYGGRTVPMATMSHQYFLTDEIPDLKAWSETNGRKVPLLRDVDSSYYLRQDKFGLNLGPYERNCRAHWHTPDDPMPEDFSFQLYPDDLERLEWYIEDAMARVPILGTAGVGRVINGPIPYAPDGLPDHLTLADHTRDYTTLMVTGPRARELFGRIGTDADLTLPWLTFQDANVAGQRCTLARVSFAGELGWEIHATNAAIPALYDAVINAGATPFGMFALNALRIEKGYRAWKGDLSTDYTLLEGGLDRFIRFDKPDFPGKAALMNERQKGSAKRFVTLTLEQDCGIDAPSMATVRQGDKIVGETTSGARGIPDRQIRGAWHGAARCSIARHHPDH